VIATKIQPVPFIKTIGGRPPNPLNVQYGINLSAGDAWTSYRR